MLSRKVPVSKALQLLEGEELWEFVRKLNEALAVKKRKSRMYPYIFGVYDGYIIAKDSDTGKYFRFDFSRDGEDVVLGDEIEVRIAFVPVDAVGVEKSVDGGSGGEDFADIAPPLWNGVLR